MARGIGPNAMPNRHVTDLSYEIELPSGPVSVHMPFVTGVLADLSPSPINGDRLCDPHHDHPSYSSRPTDRNQLCAVGDRHFHCVSHSTFDEFFAFMAPTVKISVPDLISGSGEREVSLTFSKLEDFQPEAIARQVPGLLATEGSGDSAPPLQSIKGQQQLALILGSDELARLINTWCGLYLLTAQARAGSCVEIHVMHLSRKDLAKTVKKYRGTAWDSSPLFKKLCEQEYGQPGGHPYGCVVGDYYFDHSAPDLETLHGMAQIAAAARFVFLTAASPVLLQLGSWRALNPDLNSKALLTANCYGPFKKLREDDDSRFLFLALPELHTKLSELLKLRSVDSMHEASDSPSDRDLGLNPAYALAEGLVRTFHLTGWFSNGFHDNLLPAVPITAVSEASFPNTKTEHHEALRTVTSRLHDLGLNQLVSSPDGRLRSPSVCWLHQTTLMSESPGSSTHLPALLCQNRIMHFLNSMCRDRDLEQMEDDAYFQEIKRWLDEFQAGNGASKSLFKRVSFPSQEMKEEHWQCRKEASFEIELGQGFEVPGSSLQFQIPGHRLLRQPYAAPELVVGVLLDMSPFTIDRGEVEERRFLEVNVSNFDARLKSCRCGVSFDVPNEITGPGDLNVDLTFESLGDFEPAAVSQKIEPFEKLLLDRLGLLALWVYTHVDPRREGSLTQALTTPEALPGLVSKIGAWRRDLRSPSPPMDLGAIGERVVPWTMGYAGTKSEEEIYNALGTLDRWLESQPGSSCTVSTQFLCRIIGEIDRLLSHQLDHILHHRSFTALEGIWRGLWWLVRAANDDSRISIRFMDISKVEYLFEWNKSRPAEKTQHDTPVRRAVSEECTLPGGKPYDILIVDWVFGKHDQDAAILHDLCTIAASSNATLYAPVAPDFLGVDSWDELRAGLREDLQVRNRTWNRFWHWPESANAVLLAPELLARLPYVRNPEEIGGFHHQESIEGLASCLWTRPTFAAVARIIEEKLDGNRRSRDAVRPVGKSMRAWDSSVASELRTCGINVVPFESLSESETFTVFPDRARQ